MAYSASYLRLIGHCDQSDASVVIGFSIRDEHVTIVSADERLDQRAGLEIGG